MSRFHFSTHRQSTRHFRNIAIARTEISHVDDRSCENLVSHAISELDYDYARKNMSGLNTELLVLTVYVRDLPSSSGSVPTVKYHVGSEEYRRQMIQDQSAMSMMMAQNSNLRRYDNHVSELKKIVPEYNNEILLLL